MRLRPIIITLAAFFVLGWMAWDRHTHPLSTGDASSKGLPRQCPMHPWMKSKLPGKCSACGMDLVVGSTGADLVLLPPSSPNILGIQTADVKKLPLVRTLRFAGMIGEDMSRHGVISAPVEGRIDGLSMNHEGQQVTRRQPLATMFSRTLLAAANDYNLALKQGPEAAEPAKHRLEQYGLVWEQIKAIPQRQPDDLYFGVLSPLSGVIVKSYVSEGENVKEGQKLFEVADFTKMWFMFSAYEQDLPFLRIGQIVTLNAPHLPGETMKARITSINPNLDEMTHSAMVRVVIENPERRIKNKTYAEGTVELDAPEVLAVPRGAVLWPGDSPRVYVEKAAGSLQARKVKLGRAGNALWEIIDGLKEGERVVTSGNMLIDSQAQLDAMAQPDGSPTTSQLNIKGRAELIGFLKAAAALNLALANDDLTAANAALKQLPSAPDGCIKTAPPTASADIKTLRRAFLPWSQEVATLALKTRLPEPHIFRCPMTDQLWPGAPPNAAWVQFSGELRNPYWGKEMQECGVEVKP